MSDTRNRHGLMITDSFFRDLNRLAWIVILLLASASSADAAAPSPVGLWRTIDDHTGKPRGLVRITEVAGEYRAKVEKIFPKPGEDPNPLCQKCEGERQNQPVIGMTIMWGLTRQGDEYQGGEILDPETGKVYRVKMNLEQGGEKLQVRGFIGFSLLGRTQVWIREE
jgi:uncharacterized protein (DUF2147 family)